MKILLKILKYMATRILIVAVVLGVIFSAFLSSMKTTNVFILLTDGMKKRTDVILLQQDVTSMSKYFSTHFIDTDNFGQLQQEYDNYVVSNYGYKLNIKNAFTWPWQTSKTVIVQEAVYSIDGSLDTVKMPKDEAIRLGKLNPPQWKNSIYKVKLVNDKGTWLIDDINYMGEYDFKLTPLRSLPAEVLASLRPTQPAVTGTPAPTSTAGAVLNLKGTVVIADNAPTVNVRKGPSTSYEIMAELKNNEKVNITGEKGAWYQLKLKDGQVGYISKMYISLD